MIKSKTKLSSKKKQPKNLVLVFHSCAVLALVIIILAAILSRMGLLSVLICIAAVFSIAFSLICFFLFRKNEQNLSRQFTQQQLMSSISSNFISKKDITVLINENLKLAGEFLNVHRIMLCLTDKNYVIQQPSYYWCKSNTVPVLAESEIFSSLVKDSFSYHNPSAVSVSMFCNDVNSNEKYHYMKSAGITAFVWTPLYINDTLWAILGVECFSVPRIWAVYERQLIAAVGSLIAGAAYKDINEKQQNAAREAAEMASQAKSDFLSNMSHEIRTPMNAVIGMTAIAKASRDIEKKDQCLKKIEEASAHLLGVINDILDMSKIEAKKFELSLAEFDFEKMLHKVETVSLFRMEDKKQIFTIDIDKEIPAVLIGDDQRLVQVITNLISNAVKFTPEGGSIHLESKLLEDNGEICTILISVTDSGIGITEEQKNKLFSSFVQADSSTSRHFGGTGLGLSISKRIVEMMHGKIWVESQPKMGSTFSFTIMLKKGIQKEIHNLLDPGIDWANVRILVVDDDATTIEFFNRMVDWFGINSSSATGPAEALNQIDKNGFYDIYFVNWHMPGMDGIELIQQIRSRTKDTSKSVIVLMTLADWSEIKDKATLAGVDKYIAKPLFPSAIAECINQCVGRYDKNFQEKEIVETDNFAGRRILLAEDVEINREIVLSLLEPTGLIVECAENGIEAVDLFTANPGNYDMIFMDIQMPEMDGYDATKKIREFEKENPVSETLLENAKHSPRLSGRPQGVPIIAMTANVFKEDIEKCLAAGMDGHVGKPLDIEKMMEQLRKYIR